MISFFRKIRQNLLAQNRVTRYLLYAIGEIVLVMIGILLALQVNTWNENRKLINQEKTYISRLIAENKSDVTTLTSQLELLTNNNEKIAAFTDALKSPGSSDSLIIVLAQNFIIYGSLYPQFNPSKSTYEDLSSTGNLSIIKDTELRDRIVFHYHRYQYIDWSFNVNSDWAMPIDATLFTETDALIFDTAYTSHLFPDKTNNELAKMLRNNRDIYMRNAALHYWINKDCIADLELILNDVTDFIEMLETVAQKKP
ncbi:DUF6090 family protein [Halocola ammonii]